MPVAQPNRPKRMFLGPHGLRGGWRVLIFAALLVGTAGPINPLAFNVVVVLPSSSSWSRRPGPTAFRSSIAPPTDASVYASTDTSRCRPQDSRPGWIRYSPFLYGSCIPYEHAGLYRR